MQIKQLVEIVMSRVELMPADESFEQHTMRQKEENQSVETDKSAIDGLFKGCFSRARLTNIRYDEDDRVHVCSHCGHEFTGGPLCEQCGVDFEGEDEALRDDFSDLEEMEFDLDEEGLFEDDEEDESYDWGSNLEHDMRFADAHAHDFLDHHPFHSYVHHNHVEREREARRPRVEEISSDDSEGDSDGNETTTSSMRDFIEQDDGSHANGRGPRPQVIDSDSDGSDEGGDVSNRRHRQPARRPPNRPIVVDSDSEAEESVSVDSCGAPRRFESEDHSEVGYGRDSDGAVRDGWSPLDQDDDSESEEADPFIANTREIGTDSDTTVGHQESDDEDDENTSRDDRSPTPRLAPAPDPPRRPWEGHGMAWQANSRTGTDPNRPSARREQRRREQKDRERERERRERRERANERSTSVTTVRYDSSDNDETSTDHDGDVEMSVSPTANMSRASSRSVEVLGSANDFHDVDESSSEGSIQPANRRRARPRQTAMAAASAQEYDPRISMMFAQHQSDLRDVTARESPFYEHRRDMSWRMEAPSRSRRRAQYSLEPPIQGSSARLGQDSITISAPVRSRRAQRNHREYQA